MQPFEALESMEKVESGCAQLLPSRGTMEFEARLALVLGSSLLKSAIIWIIIVTEKRESRSVRSNNHFTCFLCSDCLQVSTCCASTLNYYSMYEYECMNILTYPAVREHCCSTMCPSRELSIGVVSGPCVGTVELSPLFKPADNMYGAVKYCHLDCSFDCTLTIIHFQH